ncbi:MAG: L,D-transpeptidase [Gaiellales bacterium]
MHLSQLARRSATLLGLTTLLALPISAQAADLEPIGVDTPAPAVTSSATKLKAGSCVHPGDNLAAKPVEYRWKSRKTAWRARPMLTSVSTYARPTTKARKNGKLTQNTMHTGIEAYYLVLDARQIGETCWMRMRMPAEPKQRGGWVDRDDLQLSRTPWQIEVSLSKRTVTLYRKGQRKFSTRAVIGKASTPTPTTRSNEPFAMYDAKRGMASEFTGTWQLAMTARSAQDPDLGRIGIHGRGGASLSQAVGTAASHGCIRANNASVNRIVRLIGLRNMLGIPVVITK